MSKNKRHVKYSAQLQYLLFNLQEDMFVSRGETPEAKLALRLWTHTCGILSLLALKVLYLLRNNFGSDSWNLDGVFNFH